jgi:small conductance mechanosensitive channel
VITEAAGLMAKEDPWNERLWGPVEILGLDSVLLDSMTVRVTAKTMPGKSLSVERELRWRIKLAFDGAGIRMVGGVPAQADEPSAADPTAGMAAPSAYASTTSPQSLAATPIPPSNLAK